MIIINKKTLPSSSLPLREPSPSAAVEVEGALETIEDEKCLRRSE